MKTKKILTLFAILILSICTFFGCARVEMIRTIDEYFVITDKIFIEFDEQEFLKNGKSVSEVISKLDKDFDTLKEHIDNWKSQFSEYPDIMKELETGIVCDKVNSIKNQYSVYIEFKNSKMFYLFYGYYGLKDFEYFAALQDIGPFIDKMVSDEYLLEDYGIFFYKFSKLTSNNIKQDLREFTYEDRNICNEYSQLTGFTLDDVELVQLFSYPDDRLYSNADFMEEYGGVSFFGWEYGDKAEDFELEIYKLYPKYATWFILALIISAIVVVALIIMYYVKYRKQVRVLITKSDVENER